MSMLGTVGNTAVTNAAGAPVAWETDEGLVAVGSLSRAGSWARGREHSLAGYLSLFVSICIFIDDIRLANHSRIG
jgi:hypothetical protein